jgi:hypothetical protein
MKSRLETQIDEIYKLPLGEFTAARNALAKTLEGSDKKAVASLVKPSLPMWIVNQLFWQDAPTYKALIDASEKLRAAHRAALGGRNTDTRKPDDLHRSTLETALVKALAIASNHGTRVTDPVRDAVRRTLAALPTDELRGRLTREPPPAGFSLLTGVRPRPAEEPPSPRNKAAAKEPRAPAREELRQQKRIAQLAERRAREEERKARLAAEKERRNREKREREIRKAEQALRDAERRLAELKG